MACHVRTSSLRVAAPRVLMRWMARFSKKTASKRDIMTGDVSRWNSYFVLATCSRRKVVQDWDNDVELIDATKLLPRRVAWHLI